MNNNLMSLSFTKNKFFLISFSLLISCGSQLDEQATIPDYVLNEEKFTKLIVDFALSESISNINVKSVTAEKLDSVYAFNPLFENKVSKAEYDSSIIFYSKHPLLYKKIYENVLVTLSKMQIKKDSTKVDPILK